MSVPLPPAPPRALSPARPEPPSFDAPGRLWPGLLLGSIAGGLVQLTQPALWPVRAYLALLLAGAGVAWAAGRRRSGAGGAWLPGPWLLSFAAAAWMAFAVCGLRAGAFLSDALAPALEGRDVRVVGIVAAMPQPTDAGVRLRLAVESAWLVEVRRGKAPARKRPRGEEGRVRTDGRHAIANANANDAAEDVAGGAAEPGPDGGGAHHAAGRPVAVPPLIDVGWSTGAPWFARGGDAKKSMPASASSRSSVASMPAVPPLPAVRAGERWELTVRLTAPHGLRNPGGFDAELWLWEQGVQATGTVRAGSYDAPPVRWEAAPWWRHPVEQARQRVRDAILARLAPPTARGTGDGKGGGGGNRSGSGSGSGSDADGGTDGGAEGGTGAAGRGLSEAEAEARRRAAGVVAALVTGDQRAIDRADWDVFRATGVAHLVSISGLHITLFAWIAAAVVGWLWRRSELLCLAVPAPWAALACGVLLAAAYALFSGWAVPAQRTVCMLSVIGALRLSGRRWPWPQVWLLAGAAVVAADPWALLQAGFWLSFVAVAVLFASDAGAAGAGTPARGVVRRWAGRALALLREQWVVTLALTPLTVLLFGQTSVVGFVANLAAIPWMTLVVTPLALLGVLWAPLWSAAAACLVPFAAWLQWLAAWPWATVSLPAAPLWAGVAGVAGGVLLVLRLPVPLRLLGLPLLLPALWWQPQRPSHGQFELLAPDVGQGSAVLVRTARHALLYDAGPRFGPDSDAGDRVLVPLLRARGERLDRLLLSHRDSDHTGGAAAVLAAHPRVELWGSLEDGHALEAGGARTVTRCEAGQHWTWDGVRFDVLHPPPGTLGARGALQPAGGARDDGTNAASCVLRITAAAPGGLRRAGPSGGRSQGTRQGGDGGNGEEEAEGESMGSGHGASALLVGDIGQAQEAALAKAGLLAPADVLVVPHHGSRSSSGAALLDAVRPRTAVVQAGYRNRYGHPAPDVLARYVERGAQVVDSPWCGAWEWRSDQPLRWRCERGAARRYWHHAPPPAWTRAAADGAGSPRRGAATRG